MPKPANGSRAANGTKAQAIAKKPGKDVADSQTTAEEVDQLHSRLSQAGVELALLRLQLQQRESEYDALRTDVQTHRADDAVRRCEQGAVLEHEQRTLEECRQQATQLQQEAEALKAELAQNKELLARFKVDFDVHTAKLCEVADLTAEHERLDSVIQQKARIKELALAAAAVTELRVVFDQPWLLRTTQHRLQGPAPRCRPGSALACVDGKALLLHGGQRQGGEAGDGAVLLLAGARWEPPIAAQCAEATAHHSLSPVAKGRLLQYGGLQGGRLLGEVALLNTDTMVYSVTTNFSDDEQPSPRHSHAAASLPDQVVIFGGCNSDGPLADLWSYSVVTAKWTAAAADSSKGSKPPSARHSASLTPSVDGTRLWLFGGADASGSLGELHCFDTTISTWVAVKTVGPAPAARQGHAAAMIGGLLLISGGANIPTGSSTAATQQHGDTWVLDTSSPIMWECLDDGAWASKLLWPKHVTANCCFVGQRLYTLKPNRDERLTHMQVLELTLPSDFELLRKQRKEASVISTRLEILGDPERFADSIHIRWRAPTANSERLVSFKLLLANTSGGVSEIYNGLETNFRAHGLKPRTEFVVCVKAAYADGSYLYSDSKVVSTKAA